MKDQLDFEKDINNKMTMAEVIWYYFPEMTRLSVSKMALDNVLYGPQKKQACEKVYDLYLESLEIN